MWLFHIAQGAKCVVSVAICVWRAETWPKNFRAPVSVLRVPRAYANVAATPTVGRGVRGLRGPQYFQRAVRTALIGSPKCRAMPSSLPNLASAACSLAIMGPSQAFTLTVPSLRIGAALLSNAWVSPIRERATSRSAGPMAASICMSSSVIRYARNSENVLMRLSREMTEFKCPRDERVLTMAEPSTAMKKAHLNVV